LVLLFWYRLTRVVPDKGPLNVCLCVLQYLCATVNVCFWFFKILTQPSNGRLSGTTRVSRYQKMHSPTHTHEEVVEGFAQTTKKRLAVLNVDGRWVGACVLCVECDMKRHCDMQTDSAVQCTASGSDS